ncbi:putative major capsid protein [Ruegeria phage vB_RpoS-V10]|nr:putative major capsid protein [Ruegeria phage vB_RpoS-V10]
MITLLEAAKLNPGEVLRNTIIEHFAFTSDLLRVTPFLDVAGGAYVYNLEGSLPGVAFRGVNEAYTASAGIMNPETERLRIGGGELKVDNAVLKMHGSDVRSQHELRQVKALSLTIGAKMINGDSTADPREFDGLRTRIVGDQLLDAGSTDGGDALSVSALRDLIDATDNPTHLIMSKKMRNLLSAAATDTTIGGYIAYDKDEFGRRVTMFDGLPIVVTDYDAEGKQIIDFNEVGVGGATATASSIYCVNMGDEGVTGLQNGTMEVRDLGEMPTQPAMLTRVEWLVGMAVLHGRAAARLRGIAKVAVVK